LALEGWTLQTEIPNPGSASNTFGIVALDGDTLIGGAPDETNVGGSGSQSRGAVYIYQRSAGVWTLVKTLNPPGPTTGRRFGLWAAIDGDTLVVTELDNVFVNGGVQTFREYVYERQNGVWPDNPVATLAQTSPNPRGVTLSVQVDGNTVVVIDDGYNDNLGDRAAISRIYAYDRPAAGWPATPAPTVTFAPADVGGPGAWLINADVVGNTLFIFGRDPAHANKTWVLTRTGLDWSQRSLTATLSYSSALSGSIPSFGATDGDVVVHAGAVAGAGAFGIWERPATGWADATETFRVLLPAAGGLNSRYDVDGSTLISWYTDSSTSPATNRLAFLNRGAGWGQASTQTFPIITGPGSPTVDQATATTRSSVYSAASAEVALTLEKTDSADPVDAGASFSYDLRVRNTGSIDATEVLVTDTLPAGVSVGALPNGCAESGGVVTCALDTLAAGSEVTVTLPVIAPSMLTRFGNSARVTSHEPDTNPPDNNDSEFTDVRIPGIEITDTSGVPND
jgi:uncharacterized repeat protein (TIGR01451 family)